MVLCPHHDKIPSVDRRRRGNFYPPAKFGLDVPVFQKHFSLFLFLPHPDVSYLSGQTGKERVCGHTQHRQFL